MGIGLAVMFSRLAVMNGTDFDDAVVALWSLVISTGCLDRTMNDPYSLLSTKWEANPQGCTSRHGAVLDLDWMRMIYI